MKLYETYFAIEELWRKVEDVMTGDQIVGEDGLPVSQDDALDWIEEALSSIEDERDQKALNIACIVKNLRAEAEAVKAEKIRLQRRQTAIEKATERVTNYLTAFLPDGIRLKDGRTMISWRRSNQVIVTIPAHGLPDEFQRVKVEPDLIALKEALKSGETIHGAELQEKNNIQIK